MKFKTTMIAVFLCALFFNLVHASTYNHARLAELLKKLNDTHEISQDLRNDLKNNVKPNDLKPVETKSTKVIEAISAQDLEARLDTCLQLLAQYDHLWEQLRDVLGLTQDGDLVDAVATVISQVRLARSLLCNLADYAEEHKDTAKDATCGEGEDKEKKEKVEEEVEK